MNAEQSPSSTASAKGANNALGVPIAIVLAGGLIALAIYLGGSSGVPNGQPVALDGENQPAPTQPPVGDIRPVTEEDHIRGASDAKVTIIEYSDLECPFCKRFHPTLQQALEEYPNDVRWVYRHFPLEQLHAQAKAEAVATECAAEQGRFWELTDLIYEVTPSNDGLDLETLPELAEQAGVENIEQFTACLDSGKYDEKIEADLADAAAAGGRGTPHTVVIGPDGEKVPIAGAQPYAQVKQAIDSFLEG